MTDYPVDPRWWSPKLEFDHCFIFGPWTFPLVFFCLNQGTFSPNFLNTDNEKSTIWTMKNCCFCPRHLFLYVNFCIFHICKNASLFLACCDTIMCLLHAPVGWSTCARYTYGTYIRVCTRTRSIRSSYEWHEPINYSSCSLFWPTSCCWLERNEIRTSYILAT